MTTILGSEVKRAYWSAETNFGVTTTAALKALGDVFDFSSNFNPNPEEDSIENRAFTKIGFGVNELTFSLKSKVWQRDGVVFVPEDFWALYALGETTGRSTDGRLDSFSLVTKKANSAGTWYALWNGCMVDSLSIAAPGVGKALIYELGCRAQWMSLSTTKAFTGLQAVTVGADPTLPTTDYDRWNGTLPTVNYGSGAINVAGTIDWNIAIKNGLGPEWYKKTGSTLNPYVAENFDEGEFECVVEINRWHREELHLVQMLARVTTGITLTLPINGKTWTLSGGYVPGGTMPDMKSGKDPLRESIKLKFNAISIA
jgi:hypothetical protein